MEKLERAYREAAQIIGIKDPGTYNKDYGENNIPYLYRELEEHGLPYAAYRILCVFFEQEDSRRIALLRAVLEPEVGERTEEDAVREKRIYEIFEPWFKRFKD